MFSKFGFVLLLIFVSPLAVGVEERVSQERVVVLGSQWYGHAPVWVGIERGIFAQNGFDVFWQLVYNSNDRVNAISNDQAHFASVGEFAMLRAMAHNNRRFYWAGHQDNAPGFEGLVAYSQGIEDLVGKKIGLPFDSSVEITCRLLLEQVGLAPDEDVSLVNLRITDIAAAFRARKVDAAMIWEPNFSRLQKVDGAITLATDKSIWVSGEPTKMYARFGTSSGPDVMIMSRTWVDADIDRAKRFLRAYFEALDWVAEHPREAAAIAHRKYIQQDVALLEENFEKIEWKRAAEQRQVLSDEGLFPQVEFLIEFLYSEDRLPSKPDFRSWVNYEILPK